MKLFGDISYLEDLSNQYLKEIERSYNLVNIKNTKNIRLFFSSDGLSIEVVNMNNNLFNILLHSYSDYDISFTKDEINNMFEGVILDKYFEDNRIYEDVIFNLDPVSLVVLKKEKITQEYAYSGYLINPYLIEKIENIIKN
jgi:hypothetical protein